MNARKRLLTVFSRFCLGYMLCGSPLAAQDYTYTIENGKVTITSYTGEGGEITLPHTIGGLPVTIVGHHAFFDCMSLTSVTIPNSVTSIGEWAFYECTSLTNVTMPSSVTNIGDYAFGGCRSLTSVTIPDSVTSIGVSPFVLSSSLTNIVVGAGNPAYICLEGILFNKSANILIQCPAGKQGSYNVPDSVTNIGKHAFGGCLSLNGVTIPNSVTSIGELAFGACSSLTSMTIPEGVTSIGDGTFDSCTSLTNVTIPSSVTSIGESAFFYCINLANITIPSAVTGIGDFAFCECTSLSGVFFTGNAPEANTNIFLNADHATVYYLPGTIGWNTIFARRPKFLWNPIVDGDGFGVQPDGFTLPIMGTEDIPIVIEVSSAPSGTPWTPLHSCALTNGSMIFADSDWAKHPARFYRLRSP